MPQSRIELALSLLSPSDWRVFEKFASEFLAVEFPSLRTTASPAGDGGRDAELYSPLEDSTVVVQMSVQQDWDAKIRQTVKRLGETLPRVTELIYATNQTIGADGDALKRKLRREAKISLDIRDRHWFVERAGAPAQRAVAAETLAKQFVDPLIMRTGVQGRPVPLKDEEARIALLQLALDVADTSSERNLTKSCFESLVIAALRGTSSDDMRTRAEVHRAIAAFVPAGVPGQLEALIDGALARVAKKNGPIKHHRSSDQFHISHAEATLLKEQTARFLLEEQALGDELAARALRAVGEDQGEIDSDELGVQLRSILETVILQRAEDFAAAVTTGESVHVDAQALLNEASRAGSSLRVSPESAVEAIQDVLATPSSSTTAHLRRLADSYTLFAFLRQTPDVQKVVLTVFADGKIWLDTSAVLPLIAETLLDSPDHRHYTQLLRAASDAGLELLVTPGVIEEVERHLNLCAAFCHVPLDEWNGRVPFIYSAYIYSGRASGMFLSWLEGIRGRARPEDDVREYLHDLFSISEESLEELADAADPILRAAVKELWMEQHDQRRQSMDPGQIDPATVARLVAHDVENTIGVLEMRKSESASPMGYRSWWLTMDRTALRIKSYLRDRMGSDAPKSSPALSPDFLSQYLQLGPMRASLERGDSVALPVILDVSHLENVPRELIDFSDEFRSNHAGVEERVLRRMVRDQLDEHRTRLGPIAAGGWNAMEKSINDRIKATPASSE